MPTLQGCPDALPLDFNYMTDELRKRSRTELFEDEDTRVNSLRLLRSMLKDEKDLNFQDEDLFLLSFLRARKFDVKRAFNVVKNFYTVRNKYRELYDDFNYNTIQKVIDSKVVGFLPYRDSEGSPILVIRAGDPWNPHEMTMGEVMSVLTSALIHCIRSPSTQVAGFKVIVDFKGVTLSKIPHIHPSYLWLFAEALQNCFPGRFRAVHIVNEGHIFTYVWVILKQLLTKKLRERFQFHNRNMAKLHKYISPSVLPEEYDGELGPFDNSVWAESISSAPSYIGHVYSFGYKKNKKNKSELKKTED